MKKYFVALMVLTIALALVACGGTGADTTVEQGTEPPAEHVHNFVEDITPATCTAAGKLVVKCECGEIQSETEIAIADHVASALDCEKDTVCTVCNTVLAEKTGHIIANSEIVTAATCGTAGKEKGACSVCGKIVETEIPAAGHTLGSDIKAVDGGYATTCPVCSQSVVLKADKKVFELLFEQDIATEMANNEMGFEIVKPEFCKIENGTLNLAGGSSGVGYINVPDPTKLADLGAFMITFDFTSTKEGVESGKASVFSILTNFYNAQTNVGGSTGWGWIFKLNEEKNVMSTVNDVTKFNDNNSIAVERNVKYTVQAIINPNEKGAHVFINGKYIGNGGQGGAIAAAKPESLTLRFADAPSCGYVFDNFAIVDLK